MIEIIYKDSWAEEETMDEAVMAVGEDLGRADIADNTGINRPSYAFVNGNKAAIIIDRSKDYASNLPHVWAVDFKAMKEAIK